MLKALELAGFKSFADKTRFEFPPGISVVVGPNGSGKSNVVDAIRWVLGEQSVKSLRGREMADVIFNGSGSRTALNTAEATLTLDNSQGQFAIDTPEVHVTRRVYRSGEGEYLINRQPCRLRDIREMMAGTGVSGEAYSIIEQGKVDVLLQSSARDRRAIFEEAAGISRFKAKKIESLRRLERVEQNLVRLADIVDEVESRLRSVRSQAAKARRYRECAGRLQELRTQAGLADWRRLSEQLSRHETSIHALAGQASAAAQESAAAEQTLTDLEARLTAGETELREGESLLSEVRQQIAAHQSNIEHQFARCLDLEDEMARQRRQLAALNLHAGDMAQQFQRTADDLAAAEVEHRDVARRLAEAESSLANVTQQLKLLRAAAETRRQTYAESMRVASGLGNEISGLESQIAAAAASRERNAARLAELERTRNALAAQATQARHDLARLAAAVEQRQQELSQAQQRLAELRQEIALRTAEANRLRENLSAAQARAAVLDELEQRHEGLGLGVKQLLAEAKAAAGGPLRQIIGVVAELLHVGLEMAPLIDVALGERTGYLVARPGQELLDYLRQHSPSLAGRAGVVWLSELTPANPEPTSPGLADAKGVAGRADRFTQAAPQAVGLAEQLLGRTWIVRTLDAALELAPSAGRDVRFVTMAGEMVAEGTLLVGPRQAARGLISRRSELRAVLQQADELALQASQAEAHIAALQQQLAEQEDRVRAGSAACMQAIDELADHRSKLNAIEEREAQTEEQREVVSAELQAAAFLCDSASHTLQGATLRLQEVTSRLAELEAETAAAVAQMEALDDARQQQARDVTAGKVQQAKSEERLANLRARSKQFEHDQHQRQRAIDQCREQFLQSGERFRQAQAVVLQSESAVAELYLRKESVAARTRGRLAQQDLERQERQHCLQRLHALRDELHSLEAEKHKCELAAGEVRLERGSLASRLRDDYGIELAELEHEPSADELRRRDEVDQEIAELRRKINNLGNVNLDALAEVDDLEARYATLSSQYKDLAGAKAALEQIVHKINADSRRLFAETLEAVRGHFQSLFRKLFGGGQADIVLEEGVDILDGGIDIVARPPGKEPRNISLLSGGEKTLTCVALLLAIFRSRPSPFCVLDEVDAALDEANIERFVGVLKEFLAWTQFIVVTHSKKTMTCASTLYGVTMEESGISKKVAVRFEDVSENGEINWSEPPAAEEEAA